MDYIDEQGNAWVRIEADPICWKRADGWTVYTAPDTTFATVCQLTYNPIPIAKSDAERIAELEAQLAALLARLS